MKTKYNKLSPLDESKSAKCELLNEDSLKMNILKQRIIHERSSVLQRDGELRKISEELHNRIMNQRLNFNKPLKYAQFVIHQRQNDTKKNSNAVLNIVKKEQQLQLELSKRDVSQFASYEQEQDKSQLIDKMPINKKKLKMKYRDIVKSILIKSIAQSFHDDSINVINYHSKPKSISVNEQPIQHTNNCPIKPIDQYILTKLENIAQDQLDNSYCVIIFYSLQHSINSNYSQYMPPLSQNEIKTSAQKNSLLKLIPITQIFIIFLNKLYIILIYKQFYNKLYKCTTATTESSKKKRIRCQDDFSNSKLIQEFKNESGIKNYEVTRKAQERITLYQKILKLQNESRSQSQSCYIKKKIVNPIQNRYNN